MCKQSRVAVLTFVCLLLVISYCDSNDYYCDGGTSIVVHANYVTKYHSEAVDFVVGLLGGC